MPNDETEQSREDLLHTMMLESTDGRLFYAPIGDHPQKIADLGTGTGIWAIESTLVLSGCVALRRGSRQLMMWEW